MDMKKTYLLLACVLLMLVGCSFFVTYRIIAVAPQESSKSVASKTVASKTGIETAQLSKSEKENPDIPLRQDDDQEILFRLQNLQAIAKHRVMAYLQSVAGNQIAQFQTSLIGDDASGRVQNIQLACKKINNTILLPGEQFSFHAITGNSNLPENGWKRAIEIVNNKFVEGYGGGICQVSTTLYNAVLKAGLRIDERHTHSLPVPYISRGHDATVDYPSLDLKFTNTLDAPVRIQTEVRGSDVISRVFLLS
jgi:vancomycin resistance protein YoaR